MMPREENEPKNPYLRQNLSAEEHERLTAELKNDPSLLGELLRHPTPEDKKTADGLLFNDSDVAGQNDLDVQLRSYLLRDPTFEDEKFAELEELIIEDERCLERMTLVESELIEDYLRGNILKTEEKQRFESYFLVTPERREKLKFIETLVLNSAAVKQEPPIAESVKVEQSSRSWLEALFSFIPASNLMIRTAAGVLLFFSIGTIWWLSGRAERQNELVAVAPTNEPISNSIRPNSPDPIENSNQSAGTGEIVKPSPSPKIPQTAENSTAAKLPPANQSQKQYGLQTPTPPVNAPRPVVFALFSGVLRGGGSGAEQKIEAGQKSVELRLRLDITPEYEDYRVTVRDFDGEEIGRREKLKAAKNTVIVLFSAAAFQPDDYTVILSGKAKGEYVDLARYNFRVLK